MMNCYGSKLNSTWLNAGAKVASGTPGINYFPEPTTFLFWSAWKGGASFQDASLSAHQKTVALLQDTVRSFAKKLPIPGLGAMIDQIDFSKLGIVASSAPQVVGQGSLTLSSDDLTFSQSASGSLVATVLPMSVLESLRMSSPFANDRTHTWTVSQHGVDLIKKFEAFRQNLYNDPAGHCTIGYGTLVHKGNCNGDASESPYTGGVTEAEATRLLTDRLDEFQRTVNDSVTVELTQNQYDALLSFVYNVGPANFKSSTLLKVLNKGEYTAVPPEFRKWTKARVNGTLVDLPGLVKRRDAEADLFQT
jgi:GH24 family phage-related lysozyme (muramidase)